MCISIKKVPPFNFQLHFRWKVFQCLLLEGENVGTDALRNAEHFYITNEEFKQFLDRHKEVTSLVPESNIKMQNSYLILDEYVCIIQYFSFNTIFIK